MKDKKDIKDVFILAGSSREAYHFINSPLPHEKDGVRYDYLRRVEQLRGLSAIKIIRGGAWRKRPDIDVIEEEIVLLRGLGRLIEG